MTDVPLIFVWNAVDSGKCTVVSHHRLKELVYAHFLVA